AQAMKALARAGKTEALLARALCRESFVQWLRGDAQSSAVSATAALRAAERSGRPELIGSSLLRLSQANSGGRFDMPAALRDARRAAAIFASLGDAVMEGRARTLEATALWAADQGPASRAPAEAALVLAQRAGDLFGQGSALNIL